MTGGMVFQVLPHYGLLLISTFSLAFIKIFQRRSQRQVNGHCNEDAYTITIKSILMDIHDV